jgi:radical SAM protein
MDMDPIVVFWEITRACALKCRHCRATAQPKRHPMELKTEECYRVMDDLASFDQKPIVVLTGGDPFMRRDLYDIAAYGVGKGLRVSVSPSVTALVTKERLERLVEVGVSAISFSLDGSGPELHDGFRGVPGSFERTMECVPMAMEAGLGVQLNTTVSNWNLEDLPAMAEVVGSLGVPLWDLFFLVPTGRALDDDLPSADVHESTYNWVYEISQAGTPRVKTTLGQPYRRVWLSRKLRGEGIDWWDLTPEELVERWPGGAATNDGRGILFVSHRGMVQPSGFLPVLAGDVRRDNLVSLYRESPVFRSLRSSDELAGKCGVCPFRKVCGGCRARAFALTGDYLAADPTCPFQPAGSDSLPRDTVVAV